MTQPKRTYGRRMIPAASIAAFLFGLLACAAAANAQDVRIDREMASRFVDRQRKTQIWYYHAFNRDCSLIRGFNVRIEQMPKHGTVELEKVDKVIDASFATFRASEETRQRVKNCIGRTIPVIVTYYTSNPGYSGFDSLVMVTTSATGRAQRFVDFRIAVR
jgi:hypothetical protein